MNEIRFSVLTRHSDSTTITATVLCRLGSSQFSKQQSNILSFIYNWISLSVLDQIGLYDLNIIL